MHDLLRDPVNAWLTAGALIIAFEAFTSPGLGLFLGGLGAIGAALLIKAGAVDSSAIAAQFAWCFGLTAFWNAVLWKPLRKFRLHLKTQGGDMKSNNLIGEIAVVARGGLKQGIIGQVLWSGTLMNAKLGAPGDLLPEGTRVRIISVTGNTLTVTPLQEFHP